MADPTQTAPDALKQASNATLCVAYGVFGLPKETSCWQKAPAMREGKVEFTSRNAVKNKFKPDILGSSPRHSEVDDPASTKLLHAAMRASYPNDIEICTGEVQPPCINHSFVLQQSPTSTLYGVALKVWSKADEKRAKTIQELRTNDNDELVKRDEVYWIPYVLCFLSPYPLYNLLGSYVRAMWIHWSKSTNSFHAEEVSRILSFPAPRLQDLVRIDMKDYALVYQFPKHSSEFQNFDMWPLFSALSVPNIVGIIETALSPAGRIIFISDHLAMLNIATESIRLACRIYEWTGLYVPVAHCSSVQSLVEEKGPYILGITRECRDLFKTPSDALLVDLDHDTIHTLTPPLVFSKTASRQKFISRLNDVLGAHESSGVPLHLREAYARSQLTPEGQVIAIRGRIEVIENPSWWDEAGVLAVCDHVCQKLGKNKGIKAVLSGSTKKPNTTKITVRQLQELERVQGSNAREIDEAWLSYCLLKNKMSTEVSKVSKRNDFLVNELSTWKSQFEKFQAVATDLTKQSLELKDKIEHYKLENRKLCLLVKERAKETAELKSSHSLACQRVDSLEKEKQHMKEQLRVLATQRDVLLSQRNEVEAVLKSLRRLIEIQPAAVVDIIERQIGEEILSSQIEEEDLELIPEAPRHGSMSESRVPRPSHVEFARSERSLRSTTESMDSVDKSTKRRSISDVADAVVKEKTKEITDLINRITGDCIAAIDRINSVEDQEDSPFARAHRSTSSSAAGRASSAASVTSNRQSAFTNASEAIDRLNISEAPRDSASLHSKQSRGQDAKGFTRTKIQEIRI